MPEKKGIQHQCSFCKRVIDVHDQYDMPIFDPNTGFAICKNCVREINRFLDEHDAAAAKSEKKAFADQLDEMLEKNKPISSSSISMNISSTRIARRRCSPSRSTTTTSA